jgi:nitrous oxidase accessory protein NosD
VQDVIIKGNHLENHTGDAIYVNGSTRVLIEGNTIKNINFLAAYYDHVDVINFALSVDVAYSSKITVSRNHISDSFDGVWFWSGVRDSTIVGNQIWNLTQHAIGFGWGGIFSSNIPHNITIADNIIMDVIYGVWAVGSLGGSVIRNNTFTDTRIGLNLLTTSDLFENNTIIESDYGISFYQPRGNPIGWGNNNTIRYNTIINCTREGLFITGYDNEIRYNNFIDNHVGKDQVVDEHGNNLFELNYYSDWTSPDTDSDGIVDNPYEIGGEGNNTDNVPLSSRIG